MIKIGLSGKNGGKINKKFYSQAVNKNVRKPI
jgi:hypothetical protein